MSKIIPNKTPMRCQDPKERVKDFSEVSLGYSEAEALQEAERCLECKKPKCVEGCPVEVLIPEFIGLIKKGDFMGSALKMKEKNSLPAICGRVCPQETQCEAKCVLGIKNEPVAIGRLERFVADYELANGVKMGEVAPATGFKVAIVGAGPSGLTAAGDLAKLGHEVTVFEVLHVAGGVLMYGIPEFRLPKREVQAEIDYIKQLGVKIETNTVVGKSTSVDELMADGFDAVFIGTGAGLPYFMGLPGENFNGVYSANEFLTRTNLMKAYKFPEYKTPIRTGQRVAVMGAGNVAMDAARTALRLGAKESYIVYRRSDKEMPARHEEIEHAEEEGVKFMLLTSPVEFIGDDQGNLTAMKCVKFELGEPDESGRRKPVQIKGSEHLVEIDTAVIAIGQGPNPLVTESTPGLDLNPKKGTIIADDDGLTSKIGVYAGGDVVTGAATVILAMGAGKKAASAIHKYLMEKKDN